MSPAGRILVHKFVRRLKIFAQVANFLFRLFWSKSVNFPKAFGLSPTIMNHFGILRIFCSPRFSGLSHGTVFQRYSSSSRQIWITGYVFDGIFIFDFLQQNHLTKFGTQKRPSFGSTGTKTRAILMISCQHNRWFSRMVT